MKRALAIAVAVCTLGVAGFGVGPITGSWTATVGLLPGITLTSDLTLNYTVAGFTITSVSGFGTTGLASQRFELRGAFGPFTTTGRMWFAVAPTPAYGAADLVTTFDFGGIAVGATVRHWVPGGWALAAWPAAHGVPAGYQTGPALQYILTTTVAPVTVRARFLDVCTGTEFQDLQVRVTPIPFCCGITFTAELNFAKAAGFTNLILSGINIPLVAGVSFDVSITYSVTAKSITITPRLAAIGDACFAVWGGPVFTGHDPVTVPTWGGIRVDGFRVRCTIGDCNFIEYVHAFDPRSTTIPGAIRGKFAHGVPAPAFVENEYLELGFCGAGCCGGRWTVVLRTMFTTVTPAPAARGIFGITRFVGEVRIPIMTNFTANLDFVMPTVAGLAAPFAPAFSVGWTFTF